VGPIGVCLKWVAARPEVSAVTGAVFADERAGGPSAADQAALEWALRTAELAAVECIAVSAGPKVADDMLREALACGATRAVRVELPLDTPSDIVAAALAGALAGCRYVWFGDHSLDRSSGSVPAYVAAHLGAAQALGLVQLDVDHDGIHAVRRLDGGRRERLTLTPPAVLSVEGATATLRRASLAATMAARRADVERRPGPSVAVPPTRPTRPFRPRPRSLPAPEGDAPLARIAALVKSVGSAARSEPVVLDPPAAADRILDSLREWGEFDPS
jgi:electron transfer flavoprotein beta subunit